MRFLICVFDARGSVLCLFGRSGWEPSTSKKHFLIGYLQGGGLSKGIPPLNAIMPESSRRSSESCDVRPCSSQSDLKSSEKVLNDSHTASDRKDYASSEEKQRAAIDAEDDENVFLLRDSHPSASDNCHLSEANAVGKDMNCTPSSLNAPIINSGAASDAFHAVNASNCVDALPLPPPAHHHPVEESFGFFLSELESTAGPEDGPGPMLSDAVGPPNAVKEESFTIAQDDRNGIGNVGPGIANEFGVAGPGEAVEPAYATLTSAVPVSYYHHLGTPPGTAPQSTAPMHQMYNSWGAAAAAMNAGFDPLTHYMVPGTTSPAVGAAAALSSYGFYPTNSSGLSSSYYGSLPLPTPPTYHHSVSIYRAQCWTFCFTNHAVMDRSHTKRVCFV